MDSTFLSTINSGIGAGVNNELIGGGGKDLPSGGNCNDELTGGIGQDRFGYGSVFLPFTNRSFASYSIQLVLVRGREGIIHKMSSQMKSKGTEPSHTARMPIYIGTTLERSKNGQSLFARSY